VIRVKPTPRDARQLFEQVAPDLEADLDRVHARSREVFGYKRRDLTVDQPEQGSARLTAPDFEYTVRILPTPDDASLAVWQREVMLAGDSEALADGRISEVFGELDSVEYRFKNPLSIEDVVDRLEERDTHAVRVDYDSRCRWCEVSIEGLPATVRMENRSLVIRPRAGSSLSLADILRAL
jgi:hypothetical protein